MHDQRPVGLEPGQRRRYLPDTFYTHPYLLTDAPATQSAPERVPWPEGTYRHVRPSHYNWRGLPCSQLNWHKHIHAHKHANLPYSPPEVESKGLTTSLLTVTPASSWVPALCRW